MWNGYVILSFTPAAVLLVLFALFIFRGFYREHPFFFGYVSFALLAVALRWSVRNAPLAYFLVYWVSEAVYGVLALLALNEVFKHLFALDYREHWWFRLSLPIAAFVISLVFLILPFGRITPYWPTNAVFSFDLGMHCLEVLILLLFVVLDTILVAAYDQYDFGIVRGFGFSASITILADLLRSHFGRSFTVYFTYAPPVGFAVATVIWLYAFVRKPPPRQKLPITLHELLELLKKEAEIAQRIAKNLRLWRYGKLGNRP